MDEVHEPKTCPHCGGVARVLTDTDGCFFVECSDCGCGTPKSRSAVVAASIWNCRTAEAPNKKKNASRRWTEEEDNALAGLVETGELTLQEIADKLGRTEFSISSRCANVLKLKTRPIPLSRLWWSSEMDERLSAMEACGMTPKQIADEMGIAHRQVIHHQRFRKRKGRENVADQDSKAPNGR